MAGINRLGAGPRKPGIARPVDPNRFIVQDLVPEGVENDQDYKRMVQDIEDAQQSQVGWLFGRGAFDKSDLMYLRDEEERQRFTEDERRDRELQQFQKQRARLEPAAPGPPPPRPVRRDKDRGGASLTSDVRTAPRSVQAKLVPKLRVKPAPGAASAGPPPVLLDAQPARGSVPGDAAPAAKRQRADGAVGASAGAGAARAAGSGAGVPDAAGAGGGRGGKQAGAGAAEEGLAGLLGAYGSDEEEEEVEDAGGGARPGAHAAVPGSGPGRPGAPGSARPAAGPGSGGGEREERAAGVSAKNKQPRAA